MLLIANDNFDFDAVIEPGRVERLPAGKALMDFIGARAHPIHVLLRFRFSGF